MKRKYSKVYQFKVALKGIKPPVWRRILVPEIYTFWDLHVAIQDAMAWLDYHLHEFTIVNPSTGLVDRIGIPDEDFLDEEEVYPGWRKKVTDYFSPQNPRADYCYDFGDDWQHAVKLEKILPREAGVRYPICVGGKRASPPEDCGGTSGYEDFLKIIRDPSHEEYESTLEWAGEAFDPERFDPADVRFDDPQKRWTMAFRDG
jgi:Plasmid pRiA4b ORF-3-like protein